MTVLVLWHAVVGYSCPCLYHTVSCDHAVYFSVLLLHTQVASSLGKYQECHCEILGHVFGEHPCTSVGEISRSGVTGL